MGVVHELYDQGRGLRSSINRELSSSRKHDVERPRSVADSQSQKSFRRAPSLAEEIIAESKTTGESGQRIQLETDEKENETSVGA